MIDLFEHNKTAYDSAVSLLSETGKAAVIHPTGTGKSFIGFKLCEDHPDKVICWLSPSEYIFKTQLENLAKVSDGWQPENIRFYTYARLMNLAEEELADIHPDYIVLDEFHRCGAQEWGKGVTALLDLYADIPILGLSATNIRYLDNQRDMADELFDGNIASDMTLGEAIVRGILAAPKYVISVFSYQQQLEKYEKRIRRTKNKAVRDPAEQYLDALRRALEKADGLDTVFAKHMTDRAGKYIVFCANFEHMCEMIDKAGEWFAKVDTKPHIYTVYSDDPSASRSFRDFKADNDKEHLKLLYCIDALNEGVHVDDVSGVILLRPTVSPIIYKQQIGRALAAGKKDNPVIFDIVLNIENLYSIGAVEEEMQIATAYYRSLGENNEIVNESFTVIDEVRDCVALFERLNDSLTASFDVMYSLAKRYYEENGDLEVPARYVTPEGYSLGRWIYNVRNIRKGIQQGQLSDDQIARLDLLGMRWDNLHDITWERNFAAAEDYYRTHGNLDANSKYVTEDGVQLGLWLCSLRTWERAGAHRKYLTVDRKAKLESIGMVWDVLDFYWERNYSAACEYYREHRNLDVPSQYVSPDGIRLGTWIGRIRQLRYGACKGTPPTEEQIQRLDKIGMIWESTIDYRWNMGYKQLVLYKHQYSNVDVPAQYVCENGFQLGAWVQRQRRSYKQGKMSVERVNKLEALGLVWDVEPWMMRYNLLLEYYHQNGTIAVPQNTVIQSVWLGKWIAMQKRYYEQGKLTPEQSELIGKLPLEQLNVKDRAWYAVYADVLDFWTKNGHLRFKKNDTGKSSVRLGAWLILQRRKRKSGELSAEQISLLDKVGFLWELESRWEKGYRYAKEYYNKYGHLNMSQSYKTEDGYALGTWIFGYRKAYNGYKTGYEITDEQIRALEELGMEWNPDTVWDKRYSEVKKYYETHSVLPNVDSDVPAEKKCAYWLRNQRKSYREGSLTESKLKRLSEIGITEEWLAPQRTPFEKGYLVAKAYFDEYGNLDVPTNFQYKSGFWLGSWIDKIRKKKDELSDEQIQMLDKIGFVWEVTDGFEEQYAIAQAYYKKHGTLPLEPKQCKTKDELHICQWLRRQLLKRNEGKLSQERIDRLTAIGMDWLNSVERGWYQGYSHAKEYRDTFGNLNVIVSYVAPDGYPLGEWLHSQRTHRKRLSGERRKMLCEIGARGMRMEENV